MASRSVKSVCSFASARVAVVRRMRWRKADRAVAGKPSRKIAPNNENSLLILVSISEKSKKRKKNFPFWTSSDQQKNGRPCSKVFAPLRFIRTISYFRRDDAKWPSTLEKVVRQSKCVNVRQLLKKLCVSPSASGWGIVSRCLYYQKLQIFVITNIGNYKYL
jgi:hypothetical protein